MNSQEQHRMMGHAHHPSQRRQENRCPSIVTLPSGDGEHKVDDDDQAVRVRRSKKKHFRTLGTALDPRWAVPNMASRQAKNSTHSQPISTRGTREGGARTTMLIIDKLILEPTSRAAHGDCTSSPSFLYIVLTVLVAFL